MLHSFSLSLSLSLPLIISVCLYVSLYIFPFPIYANSKAVVEFKRSSNTTTRLRRKKHHKVTSRSVWQLRKNVKVKGNFIHRNKFSYSERFIVLLRINLHDSLPKGVGKAWCKNDVQFLSKGIAIFLMTLRTMWRRLSSSIKFIDAYFPGVWWWSITFTWYYPLYFNYQNPKLRK